jgi:predicted ATPase/class 3 adenylate cyclase
MDEPGSVSTFVFTDIEGSSRLWEREPARMQRALAMHDHLGRGCVEKHGGHVIKMTGDGMCAVFADPLGAIDATLAFQQALARPPGEDGLELRARCGIHVGIAERRDDDYFGNTLNRTARIMSAAHGGQVLLSQAVVDLVRGRLPEAISLRELGLVKLRDLASPERLYQLQHPSLRRDFPALRSLEATPNNLPQQSTSFVGRERELDDARRLLESTRLLTLVGTGGIGKTRLSLQLAAELLDDYPDGVWLVELAPIAEPAVVDNAVAAVLGVREEPGRALPDLMAQWAQDKRVLLVLDNCEHVLEACARLATRLLGGAPGLRILSSSREPLRIPGEVTFPVPALAVPESGRDVVEATLARSPAVRLFVERAEAILPSFRLNDANAATVADICRHLDGIPLAIELAAARVRSMPVATIASRLTDRFRLLSSGNRAALPRQQTLRALIDWSHDLLTEPERTLLRRLAVFAGGWTLEGAEAVCVGGALDGHDVLEVLAGLVDKSLAMVDLASGRYRLLETIRQYAAEKLEASGEAAAVGARHLDFYLAFCETAEPFLSGPDQARWLDRFDAERENLLAAHAFCGASKAPEGKGLRLVVAMRSYWFRRGHLPTGKRVVTEALSRAEAGRRDRLRSRALAAAGNFCLFSGEYEEAAGYLAESLAIARELGDAKLVATTLESLGYAELGRGRRASALRYAEESLALRREEGDPHKLGSALNAVAQMVRAEGDLARAEPLYGEVVALGRRSADNELVAIGLLNLAMVYVARGAHNGARAALQEIVAIAGESGSVPVGHGAICVAAGLAASEGDAERALRYFGAAEANTRNTGIVRDPADDAFLQPLIESARRAPEAPAAERAGREAPYEVVLAEVRAWVDQAR